MSRAQAILVTGAGSGIGRGISESLAAAGHHLIATDLNADAAIEILAAAEPGWLSVTVRDHGPGLPAGRAQDLFRMFERGQRESATPGVGLGLALCQAIVQAHGGTVQAEPADGGGARFVVRLPRGEPPPVPAEDDPGAHAP